MPQAEPRPKRPPLHLTGGVLAIASPTQLEEACFAAPAIRALKRARPQGTLVMVCPENVAPLWQIMPEVDQVLPYQEKNSPRQLARALHESGLLFDSAILWEKNTAARAIHKNKIRQRLGYPNKDLKKLLSDEVPVVSQAGPIEHRVRYYLLFIGKLGVKPFEPANFTPTKRPQVLERLRMALGKDEGNVLAPFSQVSERSRIALVPDSDYGTSATWALENYDAVLAQLLEKNEHDICLLAPSSRSNSAAKTLAEKHQIPLIASDGNVAKNLAFLATCELMIGNDGTLPHLAAHVGTPTLTLFGPNEPAWKRPLGKIHQILREHVPCSPCFLSTCPLDHRCLKAITPAQVLTKISEMTLSQKL